ncbi:lipocalin-like domain-containing protein [Thiolinea disciformis]|uniref:lipocalin-like domain-containing protein n=1 Tax=Thiolinea disciformis TaxID=125614 RepID=UPI0003675969|nr:lipocalin-like domain-containing protein [Thiolinea disciformis]
MRSILFVLSLVLSSLIHAQSVTQDAYQVLRQDAQGYAEVIPNRRFQFPADHAPHPDYRIEWWYITANLSDPDGNAWGIQWTLFRQSLSPTPMVDGWASNQMWMAHAALSTPNGYYPEQRFARGGIGQAGVSSAPFTAWLDDWQWQGDTTEPFPSRLHFTTADWNLTFELQSDKPWVLQGDQGYSQKSEGKQASYYYSQAHIAIKGKASRLGKTIPLEGKAWLDREWSSQPLASHQQGWDWFSLHFKDGYALMVYQLRNTHGKHWLSGSWISPDGSSQTLKADDIVLTPQQRQTIEVLRLGQKTPTKITLPLAWTIELPQLQKRWHISTPYPNQWMAAQFPYWEGVVSVDEGKSGMGYMELTGY